MDYDRHYEIYVTLQIKKKKKVGHHRWLLWGTTYLDPEPVWVFTASVQLGDLTLTYL